MRVVGTCYPKHGDEFEQKVTKITKRMTSTQLPQLRA